jgi:DNA polymerase III epsilon subunit-like protein
MILSLDFETSGTDHNRNAPVSLGVALMEDGEVLESKEWVIAPPRHYKTGKITREYNIVALQVSRYTWPQIIKGTEIRQVCIELLEWSRAHEATMLPVVAFKADFDMGWYSELLFLGGSMNFNTKQYELFTPPFVGPWQCANLLARRCLELDNYQLDTVAKHFGFPGQGEKHNALDDAILAGRIYHELTKPKEGTKAA